MLQASLVQSESELEQIYLLNQRNLKQNLSEAEQLQEGFVTWLYAPQLLLQLHRLAPSIIVKDGNRVAGYALVTPKEAAAFHPDLNDMFSNLNKLHYRGQPLLSHNFYCMGQVCIDKPYRGQGVFRELYAGHYRHYHGQYDLLLTEIATRNKRSQQAHEKVGFTTIHTHTDAMDEWNVVVWDWQQTKQQ